MDIRYARSVRSLQNILVDGVVELVNIYLKYTRTPEVLKKLPNIKICMTSINTAEDAERVETEKTKMETVDKIVETLGNMGIELDKYKEVRNKLINEWFGSDIMNKINKDEENMEKEPVVPEEDKGIDFHSTPSSSPKELDIKVDTDENIEDETEIEEPESTEGEEDNSNEPPQDIPYSLK